MSSILIKNCRILQTTLPFEVQENVDVYIENTKIEKVGKNLKEKADKVIDGSYKTIIPGLVCAHHHYYSGLARGMLITAGPQTDFIQVLKEWWWRLDRGLDEEANYYSSLTCSMEAIMCGTTSVIDHHASPNCIKGSLSTMAKGMEEVGIRGIECFEITDRNNGMDEIVDGIDENIRFAKEVDKKKKSSPKYLVEAMIGGHAPFTIPDSGLKAMKDACDKTGRGIHLHIAEDKYDVVHSHHHYNKDIVSRLNSFGLLNDKSILVHGLHINDNEVELINKNNVYFAHNPRSNMNNNVGYCKKIEKINNLMLGTDGCGGNMFEEMKIALFKHKDEGGSFWPSDFLLAETRANEFLSKYFAQKFGRIEAGYTADCVILDYQSPTPLVKENLASHIVWGMGSNNVECVIVNGELILENRQFTKLDKYKIFEKSSAVAKELWKRVDKIKP